MHRLPSSIAALAFAAVALGVVVPATFAAAASGWVARHFGTVDGLPVDSARAAAIDADGFLWLATHDGLARFDGSHFEVFDSMRAPAMSGNRVPALYPDGAGRVYALTGQGDWLRVRSGTIVRVTLGDGEPPRVRYVDRDSLCVATAHAMFCPDADGHFARQVRFPADVDAVLALRGSDGSVWLMSRARDIWLYRHGKWRALWRAGPQQGRSKPEYAAVDGDGALWTEIRGRALRIAPDGAQRYLAGRDDPRQIARIRTHANGGVRLGASNGVFLTHADRAQRIAIGPDPVLDVAWRGWPAPDGVLWVAHGGRLWRLPATRPSDTIASAPVLVTDGDIQSVLFGPGDLVWVMTLRDGVYRLNRPRVDVLGAADGLPGSNVYSVTRDAQGRMWLGTLDSGLLSVTNDGVVHHYGAVDGLPGPNPWLVASAPDGTLYVATYAPGLWRRSAVDARFERVVLPTALELESIRALAFDAAGAPWIGTTAGVWRQRQGRWQKVWPETSRRVTVFAVAFQRGHVWLGSNEGVWRWKDGDGHAVAERLLAHATARNLRFTHDGALWISTVGHGLIRIAADDPRGVHALQLGRAQGLPSNSPHTVREDAAGNLWVNSNQGIFRIGDDDLRQLLAGARQTLSPLLLGRSDGLTELEGNGGVQPAAAWDDRGRLWLPSQGGVVRLDPNAIALHADPPTAVIGAIGSDGQTVRLRADGSLPHGVRNPRISYGAANLFGSGESRFRYRLLPRSQVWTNTHAERSARFTGLPPGRYRFELVAGNSDGVWASTPTVLSFRVPPYWYETRAFRLGAMLGLLLLALLLVHWRERRLRRRAALLDGKVRTRTGELRAEKERAEGALRRLADAHAALEGSNLQLAGQAQRLEQMDKFRTRLLANVSHELRTPVMLVALPLQELAEHAARFTPDIRDRVQLASRQLDRLRVLVEQLVGLVQAETGQTALRLRRLDLVACLRDLVHDYRPKANRGEVLLLLDARADALPLFADPAHLVTVFGNLVDNALKHAPAGSEVTVSVVRTGEAALVEVCDQGVGIAPELSTRVFERFYRAGGTMADGDGLGIGLALARELVELHGGRIQVCDVPAGGACFRVELPLGTEHIAVEDLVLDAASSDVPACTNVSDEDAQGVVLLVEDHPDLAAYLAERLAQRLPTRVCTSAEEARELLARDPRIRLVVSDVMLPGASGVALCREVAMAVPEPRVPVILISAKAADRDREAGLAAGACAYLAKPFSLDDLLRAIQQAWPAVAPRLRAHASSPDAVDPLLRLALQRLGSAGFHVADWAVAAHLSERQLRRRVKQLTGQPPQSWLREERLLRVRELLGSGDCKTLVEAGMRSGFDNPAYLYRSYRARFGEA